MSTRVSSRKAVRRLLRSVVDDAGETVARSPDIAELSIATSHGPTRAVLGDQLVAGASAPHALIACVRALARERHFAEAWSLMRAARGIPRLRSAARAAAAVIAAAEGRFRAAGSRLRKLPRERALELVPAELAAVELVTHGRTPADAVANLGSSTDLAPETWLELARQTFARDEPDLSEQALCRIGAHDASAPGHVQAEARWLEGWISRARANRDPAPTPEGQIAVAILDYKLPDYRRTSANIGDHIQTLASLGHLLRHQNLRFHGDADLVAQLDALCARVRPEWRLPGDRRDVAVVSVNRDASSLDAVPQGTWMLAFGWYMQGWFGRRYDFPFHPHLRPLFIAFHLNRPEVLSPKGVAYLKRYAPIGCRDWPTVRRLLELEIPAFFSGCLTTTTDLLFPGDPPPVPANAPIALVDVPEGKRGPKARRSTPLRHVDNSTREAAFPANIERAVQLLEAYRRDFSGVVTSRLHCYLPARALGVDVRFEPKLERDLRFEGLVGVDDAAFAAMSQGIREKLEVALSSILRGDDEQTVRAIWGEICAPDVEAARRGDYQSSREIRGRPTYSQTS